MMTFFHFPTKLNLTHSAISTYSPRLTGDGTNLSSQLLQSTRMSVLPPSLFQKKDPCLEILMN